MLPKHGRRKEMRRKDDLIWSPLHMVNLLHCPSLNRLNRFPADVEAEDVELGNNENDLAFDVDEGMDDEDSGALDSDDERLSEDEELGIDVYETESKQMLAIRSHISCSIYRRSDACRASVLPFTK